MTIQLGQIAPDFEQDSTVVRLSLHRYLGNDWGVLFSHPKDFTPVCTTEADRSVSSLYGMVHPETDPSVTVRSVFIIDPNKKVRLILTFPPSTGRTFNEILRVIDSLQLTDAHKVATPVNWRNGTPVIILPSLSDADAKQRFPGGWKTLKPYLRVVEQPKLPQEAA